jgi:hypothetical protein
VIFWGLGITIVPILRLIGQWALIISVAVILIGLAIALLLKVRNKVGEFVGITLLLLLVTVGGPGLVYGSLCAATTAEQYNQLEQVIRTHDVSKINGLSADKETEDLLMGLPKSSKVSVSDFQGGGPVGEGFSIGYFPATIGGYFVNTYMVTKTGFQLIPHWKLIKMSINPLTIDPYWLKN